jgi:urease accessory protein
MRTLKRFALAAALAPNLAFAHVTHGGAESIGGGLLHTFTGLDHLAALWCLGALAALFAMAAKQVTPKHSNLPHWLWLPGLFALGAVAGIYCALQGLAINPEPIIAFSVVFWGALLVVGSRLHLGVQAIVAILFAFFHGLAHGPVVSELHAPVGFYAGLGIGFGVCFSAGFLATTYLNAASARALAGLVSLAGVGYFFAAG